MVVETQTLREGQNATDVKHQKLAAEVVVVVVVELNTALNTHQQTMVVDTAEARQLVVAVMGVAVTVDRLEVVAVMVLLSLEDMALQLLVDMGKPLEVVTTITVELEDMGHQMVVVLLLEVDTIRTRVKRWG